MMVAFISLGVWSAEYVRAGWIIAYAEEGMEYEYGGEFDLMITAAAAAYKKKVSTFEVKRSKINYFSPILPSPRSQRRPEGTVPM